MSATVVCNDGCCCLTGRLLCLSHLLHLYSNAIFPPNSRAKSKRISYKYIVSIIISRISFFAQRPKLVFGLIYHMLYFFSMSKLNPFVTALYTGYVVITHTSLCDFIRRRLENIQTQYKSTPLK